MQALCGSHIPACESSHCQWHALVQSACTHNIIIRIKSRTPCGLSPLHLRRMCFCATHGAASLPILGSVHLWNSLICDFLPSQLSRSFFASPSFHWFIPVFGELLSLTSSPHVLCRYHVCVCVFCCHFSLVICHGWVPKVAYQGHLAPSCWAKDPPHWPSPQAPQLPSLPFVSLSPLLPRTPLLPELLEYTDV